MSSALNKRLANIKARLKPETIIIVRTKSAEEEAALMAQARIDGERVITIHRSYGMKPPV
jgi:hypothetical protein